MSSKQPRKRCDAGECLRFDLENEVKQLRRALSDMTLMRNILLAQIESEGIDPAVRISGRAQ